MSKKTIACTINGKPLEVNEGTTIIEAFYQNDVNIAHYCWHPGLSIAGVCRLCMVEIEGNPRLQIACNTVVTPGMVVNNNSAKVKDAVKWGLDFHLINHPLDCPICDQAGECGLQDNYMQYGQYTPEMAERKVKKRKVVDLGPRVVLDSERCILCSRCVRFTDEVSKSNELGIFNRGDRAEVGTFEDKPLNNKYSQNVVDICPVGALTSKDFRFRQRVWFLKEHQTICTGCSTGCNVKINYNKEAVFRVKPVYNKEINGYWMCDEGRDVYKFVNKENRLLDGKIGTQWVHPTVAAKKVGEHLRSADVKAQPKSVALVLTGQHTVEEYESLVAYFKNEVGTDQIFHWINNPESMESFDGLLLRGDKNPNTRGLLEVLEKHGIEVSWKKLGEQITSGAIKTVVVAGPEIQTAFPDLQAKVSELAKAPKLIWLTAGKIAELDAIANSTGSSLIMVPLKTFVEKGGTFVNYAGIRQVVKKGLTIVPNALSLQEVADLCAGREVQLETTTSHPQPNAAPDGTPDQIGRGRIHNEFTHARGAL